MEGNVDFGQIEHGELLRPSVEIVEANSYRTRGEPIPITIAGSTSEWHSVKGGINPQSNGPKNIDHTQFEILFNPKTDTWLKIVPTEMKGERSINVLKKSVEIGKAACSVAGLPELADEITEQEVEIQGKKVYGFTSPHFGQSIQHYAKEALKRGDNKDDIREFVGTVYDIAFQQAKRLYEEYGYWTDDPNPGNILLHEKDGQYYVLLIDFSNTQQEKTVNPDRIPAHIAPPDKIAEIVAQRHEKNIADLRHKFAKQCANSGGVYSENGSNSLSISPNLNNAN